MLCTAICDDNSPMVDFLQSTIRKTYAENNLHSEIKCFTSARDFIEYHEKSPFDIVFLDIVMPEFSGFDVARKIRKISKNTYIIFITTESSLVYDSFDFQPFYFIPKNKLEITENKLKEVIKNLAIHISAEEKVVIKAAYDNTMFVPPNEILYIKSALNSLEAEDGSIYAYNNAMAMMKKGGNIASSQSTLQSLWGSLFLDKIFAKKELFFSSESAKKRADELIFSLGITNAGTPEIYSVNAAEANEIFDKMFLDENKNRRHPVFSESDGIYILEYPLCVENIPVFIKTIDISDKTTHRAPLISAVVTENDVVCLKCDNILKNDCEKGEMIKISVSPKAALKTIVDRFSKVVIKDPVTIYDCSLVYVTAESSPETKLVPAWKFGIYKYIKEAGEYPRQDHILVDAATGRIIYGG